MLLQTNQYIRDLQTLVTTQGLWSIFPFLTRLVSLIPLDFFQSIRQAGLRLQLYGEKYIQLYREQMALNPDNPKPTLFTRLFDAGLDGLPDAAIKDEAVDFIIAGSDTTAISLTYLVWAVCRNDKVRELLLRDLDCLPENFSDREIRQLPYLDHTINETLRLYGPVPSGLPRTVPNGGANLAGWWIPAGVTVTTQAYSLHRDPSVFPRPETYNAYLLVITVKVARLNGSRFDPSRWVTPTAEMKRAFMPFGGMARCKLILLGPVSALQRSATDQLHSLLVCLGQNLALMELRLAITYFFRAFPNAKISALENMGDLDMDPVVYFLMSPRGQRCLVQDS